MAFRDFLAQHHNQADIVTVDDSMPCREIPARVQAEENGQNRALIFDNLTDYDGKVVTNLYGAEERIAAVLEAGDQEAFFTRVDRAIAAPAPLRPASPDASDYTVSENPQLADHLPPITHSRHDGAPYITSGVVLARDPDTGRYHICFVRLALQEANVLLFNPKTYRIKEIADKTVGRGETLDILILIGPPPELILLASHSLPDGVDELAVAQALAGDTLSFVDGGLPVPWPTEMVLFGRVLPEYRDEGPFGDFRGLYLTSPNPICVVDRLWQRKDIHYHSIAGGKSREHVELVLLKARHALEHLKARWPSIIDYSLPMYGAGQMCLLTVAEGFPKEALVRDLFTVPLVELFVLLSQDTNAQSPEGILWALTQRAGQAADFEFCGDDPTTGLRARTLIDATAGDLSAWNNVRVEVF